MIPAPFDYQRAASVDEAIALLGRARRRGQAAGRRPLAAAADEAAAGAHRPCWSTSAASATCRTSRRRGRHRAHRCADPPPRPGRRPTWCTSRCRCWRTSPAQIGDPQVRHRGTIGGSIAHGDPASDLPAALLALRGDAGGAGAGGRARGGAPTTSSRASSRPRWRPTRCSPRSGCRRWPAPAGRSRSSTGGPRTGPSSGWPPCCPTARAGRGSGWSTWASTPLRAAGVEEALRSGASAADAADAGRRGHRTARRPQRLA